MAAADHGGRISSGSTAAISIIVTENTTRPPPSMQTEAAHSIPRGCKATVNSAKPATAYYFGLLQIICEKRRTNRSDSPEWNCLVTCMQHTGMMPSTEGATRHAGRKRARRALGKANICGCFDPDDRLHRGSP
jgi:hypothetical protein